MNATPETPNTLDQFAKFAQEFASKPNTATALTWGYEIESNTMANVKASADEQADYRIVNIVDWQSDGSVSDESDYCQSDDCSCECDECYHSCDCDHCDHENTHECGERDCYGGSSDYQEVASIGAIIETHPITLDHLATWGLNEATFNADCGIHVHIGSEHLSAPQVANVMTAYRLAKPVLDRIAERADIYYAQSHSPEMENDYRAGLLSGSKYQAVNVSGAISSHRAKTIEFRQMGATTRTDLKQTDRVRAWSEILRLLVGYATKPAPALYWISKATDLDSLLRLLKA